MFDICCDFLDWNLDSLEVDLVITFVEVLFEEVDDLDDIPEILTMEEQSSWLDLYVLFFHF